MNGRDIWRLKTYSTQIIFTSTINYDKFETIIIKYNKNNNKYNNKFEQNFLQKLLCR